MFKSKQRSPIERRLEKLQQEMASVQRELKTAARGAPAGLGSRPAPFRERSAPAEPPAARPPRPEAADGELFPSASKSGAPAGETGDLFGAVRPVGPSAALNAPPEASGGRSGREKFAHYFMAGHFSNLRPSRQESRVVRNKAILMLVAVAIALLWLLWYWRSH